MHAPRIFYPHALQEGQQITLEPQASLHISKVLRMDTGDKLRIFNGQGGEYDASLIRSHKQASEVELGQFHADTRPQKLDISLVQGISRNDRMELTLQKAVELGVSRITPVWTQYSQRHLNAQRMQKRMQHWQSIIINACEQCGQNCLPTLTPALKYHEWLQQLNTNENLIILDPDASQRLSEIQRPTGCINILIGPEGGLSGNEVQQALQQGASSIRLGSLILRTETAAIATIAALQTLWGDF